jgi:hypothetical protein
MIPGVHYGLLPARTTFGTRSFIVLVVELRNEALPIVDLAHE